MKKLALSAILACSLLSAAPAHAAAILWTLSADNSPVWGSTTGSFTFDADANPLPFGIVDFNLSIGGGPTVQSFNWDTSNSNALHLPPPVNSFLFTDTIGTVQLQVRPVSPLTNAGGTVAVEVFLNLDPQCSENCQTPPPVRGQLVSGTPGPGVPPVPEPGTWAMMLIGFGLVGYVMRRRPRLASTLATAA